jgi:hypothetical protein
MKLNDTTQFFEKLEGYSNNQKDGVMDQKEAESAYQKMLQEAGDQIPQEIKDKFKNGLDADAFNSTDGLGIKDGYINNQELFKSVDSGAPDPVKEQPKDAGAGQLEKAGHATYGDNKLDAKGTAGNAILDIQNILGSASNKDDKLDKGEVDKAITLVQSNKGSVGNADSKLELLRLMSDGFANKFDDKEGDGEGGNITGDSLANELVKQRQDHNQEST